MGGDSTRGARREDANDVDNDKLKLVNTSGGACLYEIRGGSVCRYVQVAGIQHPWPCTHLQGFVHEAETVKRSWLKKKRNEANRDNVTSDTLMAFSCTTSRLGNKLKIIPRVND